MTKKRLRTFTRFRDLPKELRDCIWEFAVQNDKNEPDIHFFSVSNTLKPYEAEGSRERGCTHWCKNRSAATAPVWKCRRGSQRAWDSAKNPSGYLLDSGLWLACVESQDVVARRRPFCCDPYCDVSILRMPAEKGSSWQRCLVTRPMKDLCVFQIHPNILSLRPGFLSGLGKDHMLEPNGGGFGIEYDPQWAQAMYEVDGDGRPQLDTYDDTQPAARLLKEPGGFTMARNGPVDLWLVDHHTLRPAPGVEYGELVADREVFKARGRNYI